MTMQAVDVFSDSEVLAAIPTRDERDIVYMTGSRTAGFGHAASDYDAFVVTSPPLPREFERGVMTRIGNASLDVTYVVPERFDEVARSLASRDLGEIARLDWVDLDFAARLAVGQALQSPDAFIQLQARFPIDHLSQTVFGWERVRALSALFEAQLAAQAGRPEAAWTCAQRGIVHAACAATARQHEIHMNAKWVHEKCAKVRSHEPRLLDDLLEIESMALPSIAGAGDFLGRCRDFATRYAGLDASAFTQPDVRDVRVLVGSTFLVEANSHAYLVKNGWQMYEVAPPIQELWQRMLNPATTIGSLPSGARGASTVDDVLTLERAGLVQFDWIGTAAGVLAGRAV
ncbi:MAG: hypothetical protein O3B65_00665 [Chloroflexi bacterium]|nr:hypothetical protein [Chloroflexota bacterium]